MQAGISTGALFPEFNTDDALKKLEELNAGTVEILFSTFYEYRPEFSKAVCQKVKGLNVNSVHAHSTNFEPNLFSPTRRVRGDGFYWLDQLARSARLWGCKNYTFHGMYRIPSVMKEDFDYLADRLREASEFLGGYGIKLCLENVHWCLYNRPGIFSELKRRFEGLSGVLDIKQARRSGYPYGMYIKDMAGSIEYAHFSDVDENGRMCLPGKGITDFGEVLKRLKDVGFDGNVIIEVYRNDYNGLEELKESLDFLGELCYKLK